MMNIETILFMLDFKLNRPEIKNILVTFKFFILIDLNERIFLQFTLL
jgi:hypothetical protein